MAPGPADVTTRSPVDVRKEPCRTQVCIEQPGTSLVWWVQSYRCERAAFEE